uniref:Uncharacterized protein n=1 Tax=Anguilla anguilla TaxID=7936 RepID=A0A0E9RHA8_ANGAN
MCFYIFIICLFFYFAFAFKDTLVQRLSVLTAVL